MEGKVSEMCSERVGEAWLLATQVSHQSSNGLNSKKMVGLGTGGSQPLVGSLVSLVNSTDRVLRWMGGCY